MKTRYIRATAALATALAAGLAGAQTYSTYPGTYGYSTGAGLVRCESINSDTNFCRVDTRGGVSLYRQLSREDCIRGRNWYTRADGIVVDNGCRAEFAIGNAYAANTGAYVGRDSRGRPLYQTGPSYVTDRYGNRIVVTSRDIARGYIFDRYGNRVDLVGYRYSTQRNPYYTQGYGSSGGYYTTDRYGNRVWVSSSGYYTDRYGRSVYVGPSRSGYDYDYDRYNNDYDGRYEGYGDYGGTYTAPSTYSSGVITCTSSGSGRTYCGDRNTAYTLTTDSDAYCVYGQTYGRDAYGTWVSGACSVRMESNGY